ncbi:MAG: D-2-hydroxyacid dehydrogenase [Clostridiales bacterium]|nr:D-2-hydroxyacid dehydrogenase [Clostridiales bacterium]
MLITVLDKPTFTVGDINLDKIDSLGNVSYYGILGREEVVSACYNSPVVICNKTLFDKEMIEKLPNLKYIGLTATGYNNVDLNFAKERGITVTNVPGYSTVDVAQHTFAFILHHANKINVYDDTVKNGDWLKSKTFCYFNYPLFELSGKTLGVFGYGDIGKQVAKIGDAFGMKVIVHTRTTPKNCPYTLVDKETLFKESDYLTLHSPLNEQTKNLINSETLSLMKKSAVLINTSRGPVIDELALKTALDNGVISHAYLDVLCVEPMSKDCPLINAKNITITPHIAWAPKESRQRLIDIVASNIQAFLDGKEQNVVNK